MVRKSERMARKRREMAEYRLILDSPKRLQEDLERQLLLNERLNGEGVDGLTSEEIKSLETHLRRGVDIVVEKLAKEDPKLAERWTYHEKTKDEFRLWVRSRKETKKTRELLRSFEPCDMEIEIERLKLLNERMCGRELEGIGYYGLKLLRMNILIGFNKVKSERLRDILRLDYDDDDEI